MGNHWTVAVLQKSNGCIRVRTVSEYPAKSHDYRTHRDWRPSIAPVPPTGTITFLFTDIEGSTKRWEQYPQAMQMALARHDELLRAAVESHRGYVFKTVGDAFCAAFPTANEAIDAALVAQRALEAEEWGK